MFKNFFIFIFFFFSNKIGSNVLEFVSSPFSQNGGPIATNCENTSNNPNVGIVWGIKGQNFGTVDIHLNDDDSIEILMKA